MRWVTWPVNQEPTPQSSVFANLAFLFILLKGLYPIPSDLVVKKRNFQSNELFGILMFFQRETHSL